MNWLIVFLANLAVSFADVETDLTTISHLYKESVSDIDASENELVRLSPTSTSYIQVSEETSVPTTIFESSYQPRSENVEPESDISLSPISEATFQSPEVTVPSFKANVEDYSLSADKVTLKSEKESVTESSELFEFKDTTPTRTNFNENYEVSSSSVVDYQNNAISSTITNPVVKPNSEKTDSSSAGSETFESFSVETEASPTLSLQELSSPSVPKISQLTLVYTKPTAPLLEILGSTEISASEEPVKSLHSLIPDPSTFVTVVNEVPSADQNATIVNQENIRHSDGSYKHGFETSNGIYFHEGGIPRNYNKTDVESGKPTRNIVVAGAFGWIAPNGQKIGIKYYADETGYHPEGDVLPTPPPSPPQILKALAWIRKVLAEKKEKELKSNGEQLEN